MSLLMTSLLVLFPLLVFRIMLRKSKSPTLTDTATMRRDTAATTVTATIPTLAVESFTVSNLYNGIKL